MQCGWPIPEEKKVVTSRAYDLINRSIPKRGLKLSTKKGNFMTPIEFKQWRTNQKLSQLDAAHVIGVRGIRTIKNIDKGVSPIPAWFEQFAQYLDEIEKKAE